ncbi:cbb3-type cytochrome oxidase assembly protein CcoS [Propionivibrio sp.]|uniref:cbb3-type cytochrome oxidase assembly protein CcoS n=1 Tax=Propionivibrio sp. TaxID=2212460 RepID=UPI00261ABCC5|nr:cbb3-type cytochrome oxidase assembly protein CcoS [Propionivibrio sp.]
MEIMYLLVPVSVVLVFLIGVVFWWSVRSGQFDDMEGPAYRILMDDDDAISGRSVEAKVKADAKRGTGAPQK